ncbi:opacity protein-like surface antigen [Methylobacterium sp. BE186]|uniref:outer membrane protein n=1 Tax=Methylobacterium sp. BE186 TaxID=2817715 RepID=UPI002863168E|nr:outer membrane beta-barrel protein [Methylobacterium sp. BE186]MDR7036220.1 opacity protein-like surface antigen [Methylobacterium sp. BE186]
MRTVTVSVLLALGLCGISGAQAADLDYGILRGPEYDAPVPVIDWSGIYFGAQAGYTSAAMNFGRDVYKPIVGNALRSTYFESTLSASDLLLGGSRRVDGTSFGGFAGINYQFDETVLGLEVDYTRFEQTAAVSDRIGRSSTGTDGWLHGVNLDGKSTTRIEDYGTIRGRAGYAFGNFLPFVTGGLAIGRAQISDSVGIQAYEYDQAAVRSNAALTDKSLAIPVGRTGYASFNSQYPDPNTSPPGATQSTLRPAVVYNQDKTKVVGGVTLGAGLEYALTQNIVLRGEYQWVLFNDFDGHKANLNTVRGGAAVKF